MTRVLLAGILALAVAGEPVTETTVVRGRIVSAIEGRPIVGAVVTSAYDSVLADDTGAYELRVNRAATWLAFRKDGYLDFQYPLLLLTRDTLLANVELRTDPPSAASYARPGFLPLLCIRMDEPGRLDVTNSCLWPTHPKQAYHVRIIKHNPWNPYFGRAGDRGGVMLATMVHSSSTPAADSAEIRAALAQRYTVGIRDVAVYRILADTAWATVRTGRGTFAVARAERRAAKWVYDRELAVGVR